MKTINFFLSLIFLFWQGIQAHDGCLGVSGEDQPVLKAANFTCAGNSSSYLNKYRNQESWIPTEETPVKTLLVNFHVIQDTNSNDPRNFINTPEHIEYFYDLVNYVNGLYRSISEPTDPQVPVCGDCYIEDSKVEIEIAGIYFHQDAEPRKAFNSHNYSIFQMGSRMHTRYGVNLDSEINIIQFGDENGVVGSFVNWFPSSNLNFKQFMVNTDFYNEYLNGGNYLETTGNNFAHELGHILGLLHTYEPTCCHETCDQSNVDFLNDVFGTTRGSTCWFDRHCDAVDTNVTNCTNNMLGASGGQFGYLSPLQIGRMHRVLSLMSTRKYVKEVAYYPSKFIINSNETWDFNIRLYRDLVITDSSELDVACGAYLGEVNSITVETGSSLVLNADLNCSNNSSNFEGITIKNGGYLEVVDSDINDYSITVKNGGTIKIVEGVTISGNNQIHVESGGYICITDTATITLQDDLSLINLHSGYLLGLNPALSASSGACVSNLADIVFSGNGSINSDYSQVNYIQDETYDSSEYVVGQNIYAGYEVTNEKAYGNVYVNNGANLSLDAEHIVQLEKGFEVKLGGTLNVHTGSNGICHVINARKTYSPSTWYDGELQLTNAKDFIVPNSVKVTSGCSGNHSLRLIFGQGQHAQTITYKGGADVAHAYNRDGTQVNAVQLEKGQFYYFDADENTGVSVGDNLSTDYIKLTIGNGDSWAPEGETSVSAFIYYE